MTVVLMVAEKPSLAESLAKILSGGRQRTRKGASGACSVHEFRGTFNGLSNVLFKFTSVCGHVMSTNFTGKYNNWDAVEPNELFDAPVIKQEANPNLHIPKFLQIEARSCNYLVLWLDCDKEGENICFEVINAVSSSMHISFRNPQTVYRAKFSAITDKDIKYALNHLVLPNELESLSVDARQELDLRIGCAFTRFQTRFFHGKYGDLDSALISYGPCQTPTLGFCVDRHDKIQSFQPEPYWVLAVTVVSAKNENSNAIKLDWEREREFNQNSAKSYLKFVNNQKRALLYKISKKQKSKPRPIALNTVELLRTASSGLNIGPHQTMQIAERLYTQGYISYPRTETTSYPSNFDLNGTLRTQLANPDVASHVSSLLTEGICKPKPGHDAGDHPPITPMRAGSQNEFHDRDSWRLYDYIVRHFIGSLSGDMKYEQTVLSFSIGDEKFSKTGAVPLEPGFSAVMPWLGLSKEENISSSLKEGDEFSIVNAVLNERKTSPPDYLSEADLITLMEKHGIGTDASIPTHINNICVRNYVKVTSGRRLIPTQLGIVLVHGYQKIDIELVQPTRRAALEKRLNEIAAGNVDFTVVLSQSISEFKRKFQNFVDNIQAMDELFEVSFSSLADSGKPLSRCGACRRYLKLITAKPMRLYCSNCNQTLSLPQNGTIRTYKELKCPLDDFELLYFVGGPKARSFVLCPHCYSNPPFESMPKGSGCNGCPNKECKQSMEYHAIGPCSECKEDASLVLDSGSGPPKWRFSCNKCEFHVKGFKGAVKVTVENEVCPTCFYKLVYIEYKKDREGDTEIKGCVFCTAVFSRILETKLNLREYRGTRPSQRGRGTHNAPPRNPEPLGGDDDFHDRGPRARGFRGRAGGRGSRGRRGGRGRGRGRKDDYDQESMALPKGAMRLSDFF